MMKIGRGLLVLFVSAVLVASVMLFTACGSAADRFTEPSTRPSFTQVTTIGELDGFVVLSGCGTACVVLCVSQGMRGVYDFASRRFIVPIGSGDISIENGLFIHSEEDATGAVTYSIYSVSGGIATVSGADAYSSVAITDSVTLLTCDGVSRYIDTYTGETTELRPMTVASINSRAAYETEDRLITDDGNGIYGIYDKATYGLVRTVDALAGMPSNAETELFVLADGNIAAQALVEVPAGSENADIFLNGVDTYVAYDIVTGITDISDGSFEEKDIDYVIEDLENALTDNEFSDEYSCDNIARITRTGAGKTARSSTLASLDNGLGIDIDFADISVGDASSLTYLGNGKFLAGGYVFDEDGTIYDTGASTAGKGMYYKDDDDSVWICSTSSDNAVMLSGPGRVAGYSVYVYGDFYMVMFTYKTTTSPVVYTLTETYFGSFSSHGQEVYDGVQTMNLTHFRNYGIVCIYENESGYGVYSVGGSGDILERIADGELRGAYGIRSTPNGAYTGVILSIANNDETETIYVTPSANG